MSITDNLTGGEGINNDSGGEVSEEVKTQIKIANQLESALSFIRTLKRTNDYFTGYSLNEIIQERLAAIGTPEDKADATVGTSRRSTMFALLQMLLDSTVGEDQESGAIGEALSLDYIKNPSAQLTVEDD